MNLPNKLTLMRVILVPFFILFFYLESVPYNYLIAFIIFVAASITDALDGHIARKNNLITNFGKFLDPLADKVLVTAALCCFVEKGLMSAIPLIIIVSREFMVSGLRLVTANEGVVVAAGIWGKLKTAFTMVAIVVILVLCIADLTEKLSLLSGILIWVSTALTVISGGVYLKGYWKYIDTDK